MEFYGREKELSLLENSWLRVEKSSQMIVLTGRRRVGKTLLSLKFAEKKPHLYLFVAKKSENLLCQEFLKQIKETFDLPVIGKITQLKEIFALLLEIGKKHPFILIIDEFQEFISINPSVFSDIQCLWDLNKFESRIQVLFLGSVFSLMHKIFQESKEPLFGRADHLLHLRPFSIQEIYKILKKHNQKDLKVLFDAYLFTGGVPKYLDILLENQAFSQEAMIDTFLNPASPILEEGKNVLIEEFGKEYGIYFSILELISLGKTGRSEIESILQKNVGGYLDRLEKDYSVIKKFKPINAKPESKLQKYHIKDLFLKFWFRFIYRNKGAVEMGNFAYIKQVLDKHLSTYSGKILEQFFYDLFASSKKFNKLGSYWERGFTNEIDLVAINDLEKRIVLAEIKCNKEKIHLEKLKAKAKKLLEKYKGYEVIFQVLSLSDAELGEDGR